jgi:hypothetical protein
MKKVIMENLVDLIIIVGIIGSMALVFTIFCIAAKPEDVASQKTYPLDPQYLYCIDSKVVIGLPNGYLYKLVDDKTVACNLHASGVIKK